MPWLNAQAWNDKGSTLGSDLLLVFAALFGKFWSGWKVPAYSQGFQAGNAVLALGGHRVSKNPGAARLRRPLPPAPWLGRRPLTDLQYRLPFAARTHIPASGAVSGFRGWAPAGELSVFKGATPFHRPHVRPSPARRLSPGRARMPGGLAPTGIKGSKRGDKYCSVRGEILRSEHD